MRGRSGQPVCRLLVPLMYRLPTELSFATQTPGASGDLFIFFFLLDKILWLNTS